ncbi:hypothetical protein [Myxococcus xanthus]|uniref:hypothetical protein n=1 Tax=Myxococcus xanthus TaxID=34 RepID=UPI001126032C|nr:hypothetical protein [Myxococcus xanthus]
MADEALNALDAKCGISVWSIEARLSLIQARDGLEKQKKYAAEIRKQAPGSFAAFIAHYVSNRNEERVTIPRFVSRFRHSLASWELSDDLRAYLDYRIVHEVPGRIENLLGLLRHEATVSIPDLYETYLNVVRRMLALAQGDAPIEQMLGNLVSAIRVRDGRIEKLKLAAGVPFDRSAMDPAKGHSLDQLLIGDYSTALASSEREIENNPFDLQALFTRARCLALLQEFGEDGGLARKATSLLGQVIANSITRERTLLELVKLGTNNWQHEPVRSLIAWLSIEGHEDVAQRSPSLLEFFCSSGTINVVDATSMPLSERQAYVDEYRKEHEGSIGVLAAEFRSQASVTHKPPAQLAREQQALLHAEHGLEVGDLEQALTWSEVLMHAPNPVFRFEGVLFKLRCLSRMGRVGEAFELAAYWCSRFDSIRSALPLKRIALERSLRDLKPFLKQISTPITFELALKNSEHEDLRNKLRWSTDEFLAAHGLAQPSDISQIADNFDKSQLIYFLRHVCIHPVLEACRGLPTSRAIDEERIEICSLLIELDPANTETYMEEVKEWAAKLKIEEGVQLVDRSRVFVDTDALSRWADRELRETFDRYKALADVGLQGTSKEFENAVRDFVTGRSLIPAQYLQLPQEKSDVLLVEMFDSLWAEFFTSPKYGLDYYLSMRVRHGSLTGTLRGPLSERALVTTRDDTTGRYLRNDYWPTRVPCLSDSQASALDAALAWFSEDFDRAIETEIKPYLYVRSDSHPKGMVGTTPSNLHLHFIRNAMTRDAPFDYFVALCVHIFRLALQHELDSVRNFLGSRIQDITTNLFQALQARLGSAIDEWQLRELRSAIVGAQTEVQNAGMRVVEWFRLEDSQNAERSFTMDQIVDVAIESAQRVLRGFAPRISRSLEVERRMGSSVLYEVVDIIFVALDNARKHSGKTHPAVTLSVRDIRETDQLLITIESDVASSADTPEAHLKLDKIRSLMQAEEYRDRVTLEGGSGLLKVKNIAAQHEFHELDFGFTGSGAFRLHVAVSLVHLHPQGSSISHAEARVFP